MNTKKNEISISRLDDSETEHQFEDKPMSPVLCSVSLSLTSGGQIRISCLIWWRDLDGRNVCITRMDSTPKLVLFNLVVRDGLNIYVLGVFTIQCVVSRIL